MPVLVINRDEALRSAGLDTTDPTDQAEAEALIADMQAAQEAEITGEALADVSLTPLLRRGVTEIIAAQLLEQRGRVVGASESVQVGGVQMSRRDVLGLAAGLRAEGRTRLRPYLRRAAPTAHPATPPRTTHAIQERLYGRAESDR